MIKIEKRELIEANRKIFEAGAQRAEKRTGSFNFLTWSFFLAPLITGKEFLVAMGSSWPAAEGDAIADQKGVALHAANNDPLVIDLSKTSGQTDTANGQTASSAQASQVHAIALAAQSHEHLSQLNAAHSEAVAAASGGEDAGGDKGGNDNNVDTSSEDGSIYSLSADSHHGSSQPPGELALDSVQSGVLGGSFSPSVFGSAPVFGDLSHDFAAAIAPAEPTVQPAIPTWADAVSTLKQVVFNTPAPAGR